MAPKTRLRRTICQCVFNAKVCSCSKHQVRPYFHHLLASLTDAKINNFMPLNCFFFVQKICYLLYGFNVRMFNVHTGKCFYEHVNSNSSPDHLLMSKYFEYTTSTLNPKGGGGGSKMTLWVFDWLSFLTGSCYGHKNS